MGFKLTCATYTDVGNRPVNEDSVGVFRNGANTCCVLCDGLGGHGMGDIASSLVVGVFENQFGKINKAEDFLEQAFFASQDILLAEQAARNAKRKMKTTAVCVCANEKTAYIGHVGDSRLYVFYKDKVKVRTLDHSIPQMLVLSGEIKESEIRHHPDRSTILRVMGVDWDEPMFQLMPAMPLKKCQAFLLCSDGFWELIEEDMMCELLKKSSTPEQWLSAMAEVVKKNGVGTNMDNNSAVAAFVSKE